MTRFADDDFVIGVDGGGSKTEAVLLTRDGRVLGRGKSGAANHHQTGWEGVLVEVQWAVQRACEQARRQPEEATALTLALAGIGSQTEENTLARLARKNWPRLRLQIAHDAHAALIGGLGQRHGIALIAGTGMIAYGVGVDGQRARAGGRGYCLDTGGGYFLGVEAVRAVLHAYDGLGLPTQLTPLVLRTLNLSRPDELVAWLYAPERSVKMIAALAPLVLEVAATGDGVAAEIVARGSDALATAVQAVAGRLRWEDDIPIVLSGSLLTKNAFYRALAVQAMRVRLPHARFFLPAENAALGAARLAWEEMGVHLPRQQPEEIGQTAAPWASEEPNVLSRGLHRRKVRDIVALMHVEDKRAVNAVGAVLPQIAAAVEAIAERMAQGGRLIYVGAGTSGRLGVLDASECPPTFGVSPEQVVGVIAGGEAALRQAVEGAEDVAADGAQAMRDLGVAPLDTVVGIAASGQTPYVRGALAEARRRGALTVAVVCNLPSPVAEEAQHVIAPRVGPEIIAGSTRLKAGTAQKLVLNMLSTATMVRLGKVYDNLMVDVQPDNEKLRARARRILQQASGASAEEAAAALEASGWEVKVALVSLLAGVPIAAARQALQEAAGHIAAALAALETEEVRQP